MRKHTVLLLASAVLGTNISQAWGTVSVSVTPISLTNTALKNDWVGAEIKFIAHGGATFAGFDLTNAGVDHAFSAPIGITGNILQRWSIVPVYDLDDGHLVGMQDVASPTGTFPTGTSTSLTDSFFGFHQTFLLAMADPLTEDNDLANGANPPFTQSPAVDTNSIDFGVGTVMTGVGVVAASRQLSTMNFAFIIIPKFGTIHIAGRLTDSLGNGATIVDSDFSPCLSDPLNAACSTSVPEGGSLMLLGIGGAGLLVRRRRRTDRS